MMTPDEYIKDRNGKSYDYDGYYGAQCWDLWAHFCATAGYPVINCTDTGSAADLWTQRNSSGVLKHFKAISDKSKLKKGDWVIFGFGGETPSSHVGMYVSGNSSRANIFGQNQRGGGSQSACTVSISLSSFLGAFRPNCWGEKRKRLVLNCVCGLVISGHWEEY